MAIELKSGEIGQIKGPFTNNQSFSFQNNNQGTFIKLGVSIGEKDLMLLDATTGFYFTIDNEQIHMKFAIDEHMVEKFNLLNILHDENTTEEAATNAIEELQSFEPQFILTKSGLYETERYTQISTVAFPMGAPASTILEYSIQSIGD